MLQVNNEQFEIWKKWVWFWLDVLCDPQKDLKVSNTTLRKSSTNVYRKLSSSSFSPIHFKEHKPLSLH